MDQVMHIPQIPLRAVESIRLGEDEFVLWRERLAPVYDVLRADDTPFELIERTWHLPQGFIHESAGPPISLTRDAAMIATDPINQISIFRLIEGTVDAEYGGVKARLHPGDMVFLDYTHTSRSLSTRFRAYTLTMPRDVLPIRGRRGKLHGAVVQHDTPLGQFLGRQFDALIECLAELPSAQAEIVYGAFIDIAVRLWPSTDAESEALLDRAYALIRRELTNPKLSPAFLANALAVSRAGLYAVFAAHGGISAEIRAIRLEESLKALVGQRRQPGLIKGVAERFGFKSSAHFSRVFAARFGRSPADIVTLTQEQLGGMTFLEWQGASFKDPSLAMIHAWLNGRSADHAHADPAIKGKRANQLGSEAP